MTRCSEILVENNQRTIRSSKLNHHYNVHHPILCTFNLIMLYMYRYVYNALPYTFQFSQLFTLLEKEVELNYTKQSWTRNSVHPQDNYLPFCTKESWQAQTSKEGPLKGSHRNAEHRSSGNCECWKKIIIASSSPLTTRFHVHTGITSLLQNIARGSVSIKSNEIGGLHYITQ